MTRFGRELRLWRTHRRLTQLDLSIRAETTARHVSFLETGRSRPSTDMVTRLADALELSERDRASLLRGAGLPAAAPADQRTEASDVLWYAARSIVAAHEPQPAFVFDQSWNVLLANPSGEALLGDERNLVKALFAGEWRSRIANWRDVAWVVRRRLRHVVAESAPNDELEALANLADAALDGAAAPAAELDEHSVSPVFVFDGLEVRTVSVVAQFGSLPATGDLQVELIYAIDDQGREFFDGLAASSSARGALDSRDGH